VGLERPAKQALMLAADVVLLVFSVWAAKKKTRHPGE